MYDEKQRQKQDDLPFPQPEGKAEGKCSKQPGKQRKNKQEYNIVQQWAAQKHARQRNPLIGCLIYMICSHDCSVKVFKLILTQPCIMIVGQKNVTEYQVQRAGNRYDHCCSYKRR